MFLLRCLAGCIVWVSLFGTIFTLLGLGLIFLYNAGKLSAAASVVTYLGVTSTSFSGLDTSYNEPIGWTLIGVSGAFFILVLCCCSRIRLAVAICKSAGQFIAGVCLIVLVPVFQAMLTLSLWAGCLVAMVYLVSSASFTTTGATYFTTIADYADYALIRFYVFPSARYGSTPSWGQWAFSWSPQLAACGTILTLQAVNSLCPSGAPTK